MKILSFVIVFVAEIWLVKQDHFEWEPLVVFLSALTTLIGIEVVDRKRSIEVSIDTTKAIGSYYDYLKKKKYLIIGFVLVPILLYLLVESLSSTYYRANATIIYSSYMLENSEFENPYDDYGFFIGRTLKTRSNIEKVYAEIYKNNSVNSGNSIESILSNLSINVDKIGKKNFVRYEISFLDKDPKIAQEIVQRFVVVAAESLHKEGRFINQLDGFYKKLLNEYETKIENAKVRLIKFITKNIKIINDKDSNTKLVEKSILVLEKEMLENEYKSLMTSYSKMLNKYAIEKFSLDGIRESIEISVIEPAYLPTIPVEKHYISTSLTIAIVFTLVGFLISRIGFYIYQRQYLDDGYAFFA